MTKIALLLAMLAAGNSAQAQTQYLSPGKAYTFTGTSASGGGTISYQWYRDGEPIANATDTSYTLPENLAYGKNVEFKRSAVSSVCPYNTSYTDIAVITFCDLLVGAICWATTNVAAPNTFAPRPDMYTQFFQWNRLAAWAATGDVSGWNSTANNSETWTVNPCPEGWRLPTRGECTALNNSGNAWVATNSSRGNAVAGRFYGPNSATCMLPNVMTKCIFLPANGYRQYMTSAVLGQETGGYYWSSTQDSIISGYNMYFYNSSSVTNDNNSKAYGFTIRCVQ